MICCILFICTHFPVIRKKTEIPFMKEQCTSFIAIRNHHHYHLVLCWIWGLIFTSSYLSFARQRRTLNVCSVTLNILFQLNSRKKNIYPKIKLNYTERFRSSKKNLIREWMGMQIIFNKYAWHNKTRRTAKIASRNPI